ncbi:MAG: Ldh family oxidoreductase [Planctomycetes bacterium]|nr:Ldh family oxidoreductase [Planctomycetota bacterium]
MPVLQETQLLEFGVSLLAAGGANEHEAAVVGRSLVQANLRGHDSHGVMRIPFYIKQVQDGKLNAGSTLQVVHETSGSVVGDGNWGFGQVLSRDLTERLIEKAGEAGIASGSLRQSAHIGRLGEYAEMAAEKNMSAIICANTHGAAQRVAPVGGKRPRLGTNPICIGMPGGKDGPFVLDFGTSAKAEGKVRVKKIAGEKVPDGWVLDPEGNPTNDPNQLYGDPPGTILPMGGDQAYKGFGLSFMIEMLCGALSGSPCAYPNPPAPVGNAAFFIVINPSQYAGFEHLKTEVENLEEYVRSVPRIDGVDEIFLPGDPERRVMATRQESGIPLDAGNWNALLALATELGVTPPAV